MSFTIEIQPVIVFIIIAAVFGMYATKRWFDRAKQVVNVKAQRGERLD